MLSITLRVIQVRRRRAALTAMVVAVGVATITGTLVFSDTIRASYRTLFAGAAQGAALTVAGRQDIAADPSAATPVPQSLVGRIRRLAGVAAAQGEVSDVASIVGRNGAVIASGRLPTAALSYLRPPFTGIRIVAGSPPRGLRRVVLDERTAAQQGLGIGSLVSILTGQPVRRFRISGIAALGPGSGAGLAGERFVVFSLSAAQALYGKAGVVDLIDVALIPGASPRAVSAEIDPLLPAGVVVRNRAGQVDLEVTDTTLRLRSLTDGLLAFAILAIVVGGLLILNTFSISATQRASELALLRALGATRGQVLATVLQEALVVGVVGSLIGIVIGPAAALLIRGVFDLAGANLPSGALTLRASSALIGLGVGVVVALVAALSPALRAMQAAPLEALRARAAPSPSRMNDVVRGAVTAAGGLGGLGLILTAGGASGERLRVCAIGGALVVCGALVGAPFAVRALARIVAWPVERRGGAVGGLAREQAIQNPVRTAISASSLMVGLALVLLLTGYTAGLRASADAAIRQTFIGDLAIQDQNGTDSIPGATVQAAAGVPGVLALSGLKTAEARLTGAGDVQVGAVDPTSWGEVYRFDWVSGSNAAFTGLVPGQVLVEQNTAQAAGISVGQRVTLLTGSGRRVTAHVVGIYRDAGLLHGLVVSEDWFDQLFNQPRLQDLFVKLIPGPGQGQVLASLQATLRRFPGVVLRSQRQLASAAQRQVGSVIGLFYALLALSLLMALTGIAGTLSLSVHERTPELGILRALGMTQGQARALIRDESLITAAIGSVSGAAVGLLLAWSVTRALASVGFVFSVPWVGLAAALLTGALAGVLAAVPPARRAARLDVLAAIADE